MNWNWPTTSSFQSTLPREERHFFVGQQIAIGTDFNPRSHERSDDAPEPEADPKKISIHAPTRGATT